MKKFECTSCGSNDIKLVDGVYVCSNCGTRYMPEPEEISTLSYSHDMNNNPNNDIDSDNKSDANAADMINITYKKDVSSSYTKPDDAIARENNKKDNILTSDRASVSVSHNSATIKKVANTNDAEKKSGKYEIFYTAQSFIYGFVFGIFFWIGVFFIYLNISSNYKYYTDADACVLITCIIFTGIFLYLWFKTRFDKEFFDKYIKDWPSYTTTSKKK